MANHKVTFLKKSFTYVLSNTIEAFIVFLLLSILTNYLDKHEYGIMSVYLVLVKFLISFIHMSIPAGVTLEYYHKNFTEFTNYLSSVVYVPIVNTLFTLGLIVAFQSVLVSKLEISLPYLLLLPLFILIQFLPNVYLSVCQVKKESIKFSIFKVSNTILNFLLAILYVVYLHYGWEGQIVGYLIGYFLFTILAFIFLIRLDLLKVRFDLNEIKKSYSFGFGLMLHSVSGVVLSMADRLIIQDILNYDAVGVYSVAYQIGTILTIVATGIIRALTPQVYENLKINTEVSLQRIVKYTYVMMAAMTVIAVLLFVFNDLIFHLLIDKQFMEAKEYMLPLLLGLLFQSFYMLKSNIFFYFKKTRLLASLTLTSAVFNIGLNYVFIYQFGTIGAAYATLLTYFVFWLITWYISVGVSKLNWFYFAKR